MLQWHRLLGAHDGAWGPVFTHSPLISDCLNQSSRRALSLTFHFFHCNLDMAWEAKHAHRLHCWSSMRDIRDGEVHKEQIFIRELTLGTRCEQECE
jgi:hypothetical protein